MLSVLTQKHSVQHLLNFGTVKKAKWCEARCFLCNSIIDPFSAAPVGAAMFDHVVTLPLLASAASVTCVFTVKVRDAGAAQQTSILMHIVDGDCVDDTKIWPQLQSTCKCFQSSLRIGQTARSA